MKKLMATIGVLTLLVGTSFGQDGPKHHKENSKHRETLEDIPNLTEEQKTQIKSIREDGRTKMEPQRKEMKALRSKLMELKAAENPNTNEINALIDKTTKLKGEMEKTKTASQIKARSILTPEQRKVADAKRKEKHELREKRHLEKKEMHKVK